MELSPSATSEEHSGSAPPQLNLGQSAQAQKTLPTTDASATVRSVRGEGRTRNMLGSGGLSRSNVGVQPPPKAVGWNNGLATIRRSKALREHLQFGSDANSVASRERPNTHCRASARQHLGLNDDDELR